RDSSFDAICLGEGERAIVSWLRALEHNDPSERIPNIVTKGSTGTAIIGNLIEDLDSIPFPDYSLLYDNTPMGGYPLKSIITSRGCPYDCTYCFNARWRSLYKGKGRFVRRHSVAYVIDQLRYIRSRWPLSFVKFYDDIFAYRLDDWLECFCREYKKKIGLPFFILTRADLLTEDMVRILKDAGCRTISMSIEAGDEGTRTGLLGRNMTDRQIVDAHRLCDKHGIYTFTNCIIGLPGATLLDEQKSLDLALRSRVTWAEFVTFHPYPGTALGEATIRRGYYTPDYGRMHTSYQYASPLGCFTKRHKNVLMNYGVLAPVVVVFPWLRWLCLNVLVYLPHNILFTLAYYSAKMFVLRKKIYVTRTDFMNSFFIYFRSLKQELFRHENRDR
ncbi:MAG TPA: radical SAM protein, partial [Candidatus Omnitrophota bacterium]|nr:radical SAM protein [Candidatus Omnitrophota bacterium]